MPTDVPNRNGTPMSPSFGNCVLVSDLFHQPARKGNSIDRLRKTAVIDQLLALIAEQLRRVGNRVLYQFDIERHQDASRHGEALRSKEPSSQRCTVWKRTLKTLIDQPNLDAAEQVLDDQASCGVPALKTDDPEARSPHGLKNECLVRLGRQTCRSGITVNRPGAVLRCRVDRKVESKIQIVHTVED